MFFWCSTKWKLHEMYHAWRGALIRLFNVCYIVAEVLDRSLERRIVNVLFELYNSLFVHKINLGISNSRDGSKCLFNLGCAVHTAHAVDINFLCDFFFAVSATAHLIYHSCLRLSSTFFNFFVSFQEIISLFVKFLKLFLSCHCCVAVVRYNVEYSTTPFANCQPLFFLFFKILLVFFRQTIYNFP